MSARRIIVAATLVVLLVPLQAYAASRPGYQNVPNADGEAGFRADRFGADPAPLTGVNLHSSNAGGEAGFRADPLPLTGMDLLALAAFACVLLACGLLLMRATRER